MSHFAKECASSTSGDISPTSGDTIWRCIACTFDNSNAMPECEICETKRPALSKTVYFKLSSVETTRYGAKIHIHFRYSKGTKTFEDMTRALMSTMNYKCFRTSKMEEDITSRIVYRIIVKDIISREKTKFTLEEYKALHPMMGDSG